MMVSVDDVLAGVPADVMAVHWTDTDWLECAECLASPWWRQGVEPSAEPLGHVVPFGLCDDCGTIAGV